MIYYALIIPTSFLRYLNNRELKGSGIIRWS